MSMNLTKEEIAAWWNEVDRLVKQMVIPCVPMPEPIIEKIKLPPKWVMGDTYYTLPNDKQFAVDADYPNALGWNYE